MHVTLDKDESDLVLATLEFASMPKIEYVDEIHNLFNKLKIAGPRFKTIPQTSVGAFSNDQRELKSWLLNLISGRRLDIKVVLREVQKRLETVDNMRFFFNGNRLRLFFATSGVQACYSYAIALILDRNLSDRLYRCAYKDCQSKEGGQSKFGIVLKGRKQKYCDKEHYRADDKLKIYDRIKSFRIRQKQNKGLR